MVRTRSRALTLAALALLTALPGCNGGGCNGGERKPNVIFIVIDTLRADRLGCYGYPRPISPEIDELARDGALFTECVAQAPWTLPSMSSMLIGRHVTRHREWPEPKYVPLAESFQEAGYATIGVSANVLLATDHHFDRGFDHYDASWGPTDNDGKPLDMLWDAIWPPVEKALAGNEGGEDQPLFLFLQPFDPHFSYKPHPEYDAHLPITGAEGVQPPGWQAEVLARSGSAAPAEDPNWTARLEGLRNSRGLYEQEVRFTDHWIGKILDRLRELKVLDNAVVAIVSDHGEGLWEHVNKGSAAKLREVLENPARGPDGYFFQGHANHVYEEAIRTPLILWGKGVPQGARIEQPVENVDVYSTLCALAGIEAPRTKEGRPQLEGRDLRAFFRPSAEYEGAKRDHTFSFAYHVATVREHSTGLKLIVPTCSYTDFEKNGVKRELFHLPSDPDERVNLWEQRPDDAERLLAILQQKIVDHPAPTTWGKKLPHENMILNGLGYDGAEGAPPDASVICEPDEKR